MVERSQDLSQLNQITDALNILSEKAKTQPLKKNEFSSLIKILKDYNNVVPKTNLQFLADKKTGSGDPIEESIKQALEAVQTFQKNMRQPPGYINRSVREAIIALYAQFEKERELNKFKFNIENLKEKWKKLKQKLEGSEQSNLQ